MKINSQNYRNSYQLYLLKKQNSTESTWRSTWLLDDTWIGQQPIQQQEGCFEGLNKVNVFIWKKVGQVSY